MVLLIPLFDHQGNDGEKLEGPKNLSQHKRKPRELYLSYPT